MTTNCTHLSLERLPLGVKGRRGKCSPALRHRKMSVLLVVLAFHGQPWEEGCILHFDDKSKNVCLLQRITVPSSSEEFQKVWNLFTCTMLTSLSIQKIGRVQNRPLEVCQWCVQWALGGLVLVPSDKLLPRHAGSAAAILPQQLLAPGHRDQELHPSSAPSSVQLSASMSFQRRSRVGRVLWLPQGQSQLLQ